VTTPDATDVARESVTSIPSFGIAATQSSKLTLAGGESTVPESVAPNPAAFQFVDGLLPEPAGASLFDGTVSGAAFPAGVAATADALDFDASATGHLGLAAASLTFAPTVNAPAGAAAAPTGASVGQFEPSGWIVQAQPATVGTAEASFAAWGFQVASPLGGPGPNPPSGGAIPVPVGRVALVVALAAVVGTIVAVGARFALPEWASVAPVMPVAPGAATPPRTPRTTSRAAPIRAPPSEVAPSVPAERDPFDDLL